MRKNIAVFGGAFDPPTLGHVGMIDVAQRPLPPIPVDFPVFDEVCVFPCYSHVFGKEMASPEHRVEMCRRLLRITDKVYIRTEEIDWQHTTGTYDFLERLRRENPDCDFTVLVGGDNLYCIDRWKNWERLIAEYPFVAVVRPGYTGTVPYLDKYKKMWQINGYFDCEISSTEARMLISKADPNAASLVGRGNLVYIQQHHLYGA